jgi:DNA-binding transcriptional LysR family regulator
LNARTDGSLASNTITLSLYMALEGVGLSYLPEDAVREHIARGRLVKVLADWTPRSSGYHLYYPSRRQPARAFTLLVDALHYRA